MKKIFTLTFASIFTSTLALADVSDLLISEIVVSPTNAEFIEILNNGATAVNLSNVYVTDATFAGGGVYYYQIVNGAGGGGGFSDFHARFPDNAMIAPGQYQTIAISGSTNFFAVYNKNPTYELYEDAVVADGVDDMREAFAGSINDQGNFTNSGSNPINGEVAILYTWDGNSDLVKDLDYILWGDGNEFVDKSGVNIDGIDGDAMTSNYENDTATQSVIATATHTDGNSWQRNVTLNEGCEIQTGGNGINGSDETSESLDYTFYEGSPSPNLSSMPPAVAAPNIIINEVDAVGASDFIEIKGAIGTCLNNVTLVFYEGVNDTVSRIIDLSGKVIRNGGYFLLSDVNGSVDMALGGALDDTASAVAIYFKDVNSFNNGDSINDVDFVNDIIDAMVYHSGTEDDGGLLALVNAMQPQVNENFNSNAVNESNARCGDGQGGALNTDTYNQVQPTAGTINNRCPVGAYYANADSSTPVTLRTTLHDIIKGHTSYPYSSSSTDTWDVLGFADEDHNTSVDVDPNVVERVWMLYRNNSFVKVPGFENMEYNREHTWPKSRGFSSPNDNAPRTDAHHLMLSDVNYNSTRGNKYYDNCNPSTDNTCTNASLQTTQYDGDGDGTTEGGNTGSTYPGNSNWTNASVFEAWNFRKGDVARAMFYMDVRYEGLGEMDSSGTTEPDLILTDNVDLIQTTASSPAYMGKLSTLLQWHLDDPVDDIELQRNEVIFSYQGNRNPFIDHPEWVACVFQSNCVFDAVFSNGFE